MPEEVSVTFDPEIDLDDDAVGRCRYEWFYSVRSKQPREKQEVEAPNLRTHFKEYREVFQNSGSDTRRAHVLRDVM